MVGLKLANCLILNCYGPSGSACDDAGRTGIEWFNNAFEVARGKVAPTTPIIMIGDINWRPTYAKTLPNDWVLAPTADDKPTSKVFGSPTRCITRLAKGTTTNVEADPGIPHHNIVKFTIKVPTPTERRQTQRLAVTSKFEFSLTSTRMKEQKSNGD